MAGSLYLGSQKVCPVIIHNTEILDFDLGSIDYYTDEIGLMNQIQTIKVFNINSNGGVVAWLLDVDDNIISFDENGAEIAFNYYNSGITDGTLTLYFSSQEGRCEIAIENI